MLACLGLLIGCPDAGAPPPSTNTTYTITFDGNGAASGSVPIDSTNYDSGASITIPGNPGSLVLAGYVLAGWNTGAGGSGSRLVAGDTVGIFDNLTLHAVWIPDTLTFSSAGSGGIKITGPGNFSGPLTMPAGVRIVGYPSFANDALLTSVTFSPSSVSNPNIIQQHAFEGCTGLTTVTISSGVHQIDFSAFTIAAPPRPY